WINSQDDESLYLSVVTIGELRRGLTILPDGKRLARLQDWMDNDLIPLFSERILPVTRAIAERWGVLSGQRQMVGRPLSMADVITAATAFNPQPTLVTRNVKAYAGLGLTIFTPWAAP